MKTMERNKVPFWYLLYDRKEAVKDEDGNETGDYRVVYKEAVFQRENISAATGSAQVEQFGNFISYDKVIVTDDLCCPIDENTVLFIDKEPEYDDRVCCLTGWPSRDLKSLRPTSQRRRMTAPTMFLSR